MSRADQEQLSEWLSAYLDGELDADQAQMIEEALREDEGARRLLDELRSTVEAVSTLPRHAAPDTLADDVLRHVERAELLGDAELPIDTSTGRRSPLRAILSMAAMLAVIASGLWFVDFDRDPVDSEVGPVVAAGDTEESAPGRPEVATTRAKRRMSRGGKESDSRLAKAPTAVPRSSAQRPSEAGVPAVLASATLDQKLAVGVGLPEVRSHNFDNEPVQLRLTVRDERERDAMAVRLVSYFVGEGLDDLSVPSVREVPTEAWFLEGSLDRNYNESLQRQVLVRASRSQLAVMMDKLKDAASRDDRVVLRSPLMTAKGWNRTRAVFAPAGPPDAETPGAIAATELGDEPADRDTSAEGSGVVKAMGPYGELLKALTQPPTDEPARSADKDPGAASPQERPTTADATIDEPRDADAKSEGETRFDTKKDGAAVERRSATSTPSEQPAKPLSLVERRLAALEADAERREQAKGSASATEEPDTTEEDESLITIVVQIRVSKQKPTPAEDTTTAPSRDKASKKPTTTDPKQRK